jgi:hypothetical protein
MLTYLFIIFIVLVAIAPLMHFAPSKRQKQIAGMREAAALQGLYVEFRQLPGERLDVAYRPGELIYYGKRLPARLAGEIEAHHWIREPDGEWRGQNWRKKLPDALESLPANVAGAGVDEGSCGVYWKESSNAEDVEKICACVKAWADNLQ